jgi:hypothetical protein
MIAILRRPTGLLHLDRGLVGTTGPTGRILRESGRGKHEEQNGREERSDIIHGITVPFGRA